MSQQNLELNIEFDFGFLNGNYLGQVNNQMANGIGRLIEKGEIKEGQFHNGDLSGFARIIYEDGSYFIGKIEGTKIIDGISFKNTGKVRAEYKDCKQIN